MKIPGFRKKISRDEYLLILDIGTEFIKALVLRKDSKSKIREGIIEGIGRQRQMPGQMQAGAVTDIDGVTLTCQMAIEQAAEMAGIRPDKAIIGISGEFIKGSNASFVLKREKPEKEIDLAEIKNLIQKIQWRALDRMRQSLALETGKREIEIKLINALITEIRIDGYQVVNPLGFQGKEILLNIFNVYAPLLHLKAVETIAGKLDLELLSVVAEPYALARTVCLKGSSISLAKSDSRGDSVLSQPTAENAIFVDVGGGTTDVALVRRGGVEGIKSLALAGRTFTKRLSQSFNLGLAEAEEIKIRYATNQLSQAVQVKVKEILRKDMDVWLKGIELILDEFNQREFFPPLILFCGGGSLLPDIQRDLNRYIIQKKWIEKYPFTQSPKLGYIQSEHINNIVDEENNLTGPEYITPMALASLSLEISNDNQGEICSVLRRVVRMMQR